MTAFGNCTFTCYLNPPLQRESSKREGGSPALFTTPPRAQTEPRTGKVQAKSLWHSQRYLSRQETKSGWWSCKARSEMGKRVEHSFFFFFYEPRTFFSFSLPNQWLLALHRNLGHRASGPGTRTCVGGMGNCAGSPRKESVFVFIFECTCRPKPLTNTVSFTFQTSLWIRPGVQGWRGV